MSPVHYDYRTRHWKSEFENHKRKQLPRDDLRRHFPASGCINQVMGTESARPRLILIPDCDAQLTDLPAGLKHARINTIATDFEGCNISKEERAQFKQLIEDNPDDWQQMLDQRQDFPCNHRQLFDETYFTGNGPLPKARVLSIGNCEGMAAVVDLWRTPCITKPLYDYISETADGQYCMIWAIRPEVDWWKRSRMYEQRRWSAPAAWCDIQYTLPEMGLTTKKLKASMVQFTGVDLARQCNLPSFMSWSNKQFEYIENMHDPRDYIYYCALDVALPQLQLCREYSYRHRYSSDFIDPYKASHVWGLLSDERWGSLRPQWMQEDQFLDMRKSEVKWLKSWLKLSEAESASHPYPKRFNNENNFTKPLANAYLMDPFQQTLHPIQEIDLNAPDALWPQMRFYSNSDWEQRHDTYQHLFPHMSSDYLDLDVHLTLPPDMWCPVQHYAAPPSQTIVGTTVQTADNPSPEYCAYFVTDGFLQIHNQAGIIGCKGVDRSENARNYYWRAEQQPFPLPVVYAQDDGDILSDDRNRQLDALRRIESRRQYSRNLMLKRTFQRNHEQLETRIERKMQPYHHERPATYRAFKEPPEYGPRCALPEPNVPPREATYQHFLDAERSKYQADADNQLYDAPRAKSVQRYNRSSYAVRHRPKRHKPSKYAPEEYYGEPGTYSWNDPLPGNRAGEQHASRPSLPQETLDAAMQRWQRSIPARNQSRSPSPGPSTRPPRTHSVHQSRLVPFNYDNVSTDDTLDNYDVDTAVLRSPRGSDQSRMATDDSDCAIIDQSGPSHSITHDSHQRNQPVVDISDPAKQRLLPADAQSSEPESAPSAIKSARMSAQPPAAPSGGRGRGRGRGRGKAPDDADDQRPGGMVAVAMPPAYANTVSRSIDNTGRINNHDFELDRLRERLAETERQVQLLTNSQQIVLQHAELQAIRRQAYDALVPAPQQQLAWNTAQPQLAIAGVGFDQQMASYSLFPEPAQPMQVDEPQQQQPTQRQSAVSFQVIEPAPVTSQSVGAIPRRPRPILRTHSSIQQDAATMPASSSSSVTIVELSSTPTDQPSTSGESSQQQQQQYGQAPAVDPSNAVSNPSPAPPAPALPVVMQDEEVQADEAEYLQPAWYDIGLHWADGPPPHGEALFDVHAEIISRGQFLHYEPVIILLRYFAYIGPAPPGDSSIRTPSYMEKIANTFAKQLRELVRNRYHTGMVTVIEVFDLLINANIAFERRFSRHQEQGYPNDRQYAACLQAYRIKVAVARQIAANYSNHNIWLALPQVLFSYLPVHEIQQGFTPYLWNQDAVLGQQRLTFYWEIRNAGRFGDNDAYKAMTEYFLILQKNRGVLNRFSPGDRARFDNRRRMIRAYMTSLLTEIEVFYIEAHEYYTHVGIDPANGDAHGYVDLQFPEGYPGPPPPAPQ